MLGLFGAGTASAVPDVDGMTYEDAVAAIEEDGGIPKIAVTVRRPTGRDGRLPGHQGHGRVVLPAHPRRRVLRPDEGDVLLTLNCNRGAATATTPGASAASPAGRDFTAKAEEAAAAAQSEEDELAEAGETPGEPGQVAE